MRKLLAVLAGSMILVFVQLANGSRIAAAVTKKAAIPPTHQFSRGLALPAWADPLLDIPVTERKDPVVMRLAETQAWVGGRSAVLQNRAIQVNEQSALAAIGQFGIDYFPAYQKLHLHRLVILRGTQRMDRTQGVNVRLLERETGIDAGLYEGAMTLQLLLDDIRVGDTLWITYSIEGSNPVFGKQWSSEFSWDAWMPVERRSLTVFHPHDRPMHWRLLGDFQAAPLTPHISRQGHTERLYFEQRGLEALESEEFVPSDYMPGRTLQMSEHHDWNSVARWANGLFPPAPVTPALKALADQVSRQSTPAARVSMALRWVQDEIRYFSVSIGENSHRPHTPDTVLKRRYGDCKDKSYLLVSLLQQLGIPARLVLLNARAPKAPAKIIASPAMFDHVVVQVRLDDRTYYVDPVASGQKLTLEKLTTVFAGAYGLVVDTASTGLTVLPEPGDAGPVYEHSDDISIGSFDGDAVLETRQIFRGAYAEAMRAAAPRLSSNDLAKSMLERYESLYPGLALMTPPRMEDDTEANVFTMSGRYKLPRPVRQEDGAYVIDYASHILEGSLGLPKKIVRNYPLALPKGRYASRYRMRIEWPPTVRVNQDIGSKVIDNPVFSARSELTLKGNVLDYMLDYRVKQAVVPAADVPALHAQAKLLGAYAESAFRIPYDAVDTPEVSAMSFSLRERDAMLVARSGHAVSQSMEANKTTPEGMAKACDLLINAYRLSDLATDDIWAMFGTAAQALREEPGADAALCLARLSYVLGEFTQSVSLFQSVYLHDDSPYWRELAWAQAYAGDDHAALATMSAYRVARGAAGTSIAAGLDLADEIILAQRARQPLSPKVEQLAREIPDGVWPRPLLAMLVGELGTDALLNLIDTFPADKRELALNDSWFYIAQQALLANDLLVARRGFLWYEVDGLRSSAQYERARKEVDRLKQRDENFYLGQAAFKRGDYATAVEKWRASADAGYSAGQYEMGTLYLHGKYIPQDYQLAKHWFELAAANGDEGGMNALAWMFWAGEGVPLDQATAVQWYAKAAEAGSGNSAYNLALSYERGEGVAKDMQQAFVYMRMAAERNIVQAQGALAVYYLDNLHLNYPKALRWATRAAARDNATGMLALGNIYYHGLGVPEDKSKTIALYQRLDEQGNAEGRARLAYFYVRGLGVKRDLSRAFSLYRQAADDGNLVATNNLADMYENGKGVAQDYAQALTLYRLAAKGGQSASLLSLSGLYENGQGVQADPVLSYTYCKLATHVDSQYGAERCTSLAAALDADKIAAADAFALAWKPDMDLPVASSL